VLESGTAEQIVRALVHDPVTERELQARGLLTPRELADALAALPHAGEYVFSEAWLAELRASVRARLAAHAAEHPLDPGLPLAELVPGNAWAPHILDLLEIERRGAKAYLPGATASLGARADAAAALEASVAGAEVVRVQDPELGAFLEREGRLRRVGDGLAVSTALYDRGRKVLSELDEIRLASFRDALGVGRRTAQLLLERYDADGVTLRRGDVRVLRRQTK
jgi:selenocysteine-specific elongation factor